MSESVPHMIGVSRRISYQSKPYWEALILAPIVLLAAATRLYGLDAKSMWLDEAWSVFVARQPLGQMVHLIVTHDDHPPLYYALLHFWLWLGDNPFSVRLLSALLSIAVVPVIYLLGREVVGRRVGLVAALLVSLSPFQVWYAQEARMYALLALLCALSAYLLVRGLNEGGAWTWTAYTVTTALALFTQLSAVFFVAAEGVVVILLWGLPLCVSQTGRPALRMGVLRPWLLTQAAIVLTWIPWVPGFLRQMQAHGEFWLEKPTLDTVKGVLFEITSSYLPHWRVPMGQEIVVIGGLLLALLVLMRVSRQHFLIPLALFVAPMVGIYLVSQIEPALLSRAVIYVSGPYLLLIATSLGTLKRWKLGSLLLALLVLLNLVSLYRLYSVIPKEEWDLVARYVTERSAPGELVLFVAADAQIPFDYYAEVEGKLLEKRDLPVDALTVGALEPRMEEKDLPRMGQLLDGRGSFWLVDSHTTYADPLGLARRYARERYQLVEAREFQGIKVFHYAATMPTKLSEQLAPVAAR